MDYISSIWEGRGITKTRPYSNRAQRSSKKVYMEIPLQGQSLEIPVLAISDIDYRLVNNTAPDMLIAEMEDMGYKTSYSSFDRIMKTCIKERWAKAKLIKVIGKNKEEEHTYYVGKGIVCNEDFKPLMLCTWQLQGTPNNNKVDWKFTNAIIRIDPYFYLDYTDNVGRFVCKKLVKESICNYVYSPRLRESTHFTPQVVIASIPFKVKGVSTPNINVDSEDLVKVALDNIDKVECL